MLASAGKYFSETIDMIQNDILRNSVRNATSTSSANTSVAVTANQMGLINTNSEAFHILKKVLGISAASAAIIGSAYYIGYQVARKRHRFHMKEADKNDQVSLLSLCTEVLTQFRFLLTFNKKKIEAILGKFRLSRNSLHKVMELMLEEMFKGLDPETHAKADVKMFPTYIRQLPDGTERGDILALDLGGTNFRVLLVNLDSGEIKVKSKVFLIPQSIMTGTGVQLFDHIAKCVAEFMRAENLLQKSYPLGFTFSFPCTQNGLASATLVSWTKGFDCEGVVGKDVVHLLQSAIDKRGDIKIKVLALVNDTVGTLMASAYNDQTTKIGLILGTGSNACYVEKLENVKTWTGDRDDPKQVIINMEWGWF